MKIPSRTGVTAGVTAGPPTEQPRGRRRAVVAGLVAAGLVGSSLALPGFAAAAVPAFPDNIVVFPNRDMVVLEGFDALAGSPLTIEVYEDGGALLKGSVTGTPVAGAEFEINHPGGLCWGVGAPPNLQVTPNIDKNDRVVIKVDGAEVADTVVQDVTAGTATGSGPNLTVASQIGPNVNRAQLEQRIVNPDLTDTAVGRRDLRALPGTALIVDRNGAYQSNLNVTDGVATYLFNDPAIAEQARTGGGERLMAWQNQDDDGNRQGLTIAEAGEPGGPGMGGCPAGPTDLGAPAPGNATFFRSTDKTKMQVKWTAPAPVPGASPVVGYNILALSPANPTADQIALGRRTAATATGTTIEGLDPNVEYTIEVRSLTENGALSAPLNATPGTPTPPTDPPTGGDTTDPAPVASENAPVTFTGLAAGEELYFTLDGSEPIVGDMPSVAATRYTGPIAITQTATLKWAAFDAAGNHSVGEKLYTVTAATTPGAPTGVTATAGAEFATVNWGAPTTNASTITKYVITATPPAPGAPVVVEAGASLRTIQVRPLVGNTNYSVTVAAANAQGTGAASAPVTVRPTVNTVPRVTVGTARWKAGDFRVTGTTSAPIGTLVQVLNSAGTVIAQGNAVAGATATSQDYSIRARNGAAPAQNPGNITVRVTVNGVVGTSTPFAVTNN